MSWIITNNYIKKRILDPKFEQEILFVNIFIKEDNT